MPCPSGKFGNISAQTSSAKACFNCPAGNFNEGVAQTSCNSTCAAGKYTGVITGATQCIDCVSGTFAAGAGSTACEKCSGGKFGAFTGKSRNADACPDSCDAGRYSTVTGAPDFKSADCKNCPPGWFSDGTGHSVCIECPVGYRSSAAAGQSVVKVACPAREKDLLDFVKTVGGAISALCAAIAFSLVVLLVRFRFLIRAKWAVTAVTWTALAGIGFSAVDFTTDLLAIENLEEGTVLRLVGTSCLAVSIVINVVVTGFVFRRDHRRRYVNTTDLRSMGIVTPLVALLASTNLSVLSVLPWKSRAFGGFPNVRLSFVSLVTVFTENMPQIIVQASAAASGGGLTGVALVSVVFSAASIVIKTVKKMFDVCAGEDVASDAARVDAQLSLWLVKRGLATVEPHLRDFGVDHVEDLLGLKDEEWAALGLRPLQLNRLRADVLEARCADSEPKVAALSVVNPPLVELATVTMHVNPLRAEEKRTASKTKVGAGGQGSSCRLTLSLYAYHSTAPGECSMEAGDQIEVLEDDDGSGWTRVRNHSSKSVVVEGMVPTTYLASV